MEIHLLDRILEGLILVLIQILFDIASLYVQVEQLSVYVVGLLND